MTTTRDPTVRPEDDPTTVVGLIYRIVDQPRRGVTSAVLLCMVLTAVTRLSGRDATIAGVPASALWWCAPGVLGVGLLVRTLRHIRRGPPSEDLVRHAAEHRSLRPDGSE